MKRKKRGLPTSTRIKPAITSTKTKKTPKTSALTSMGLYNKILIGIGSVVLLSIIATLFIIKDDLVSFEKLEKIDPAAASQVYSADGELLHSFFTSNRAYAHIDDIPLVVKEALLSTEDRGFYSHWGIEPLGLLRGVGKTILTGVKQGGSTITMQLSRNLYYGFEQTVTRKIKEMITSIQLERTYSKDEILEMYLNITSYGSNAYGIKAAARRFFDKDLEDLKTEEAALLIGILKGPTRYSPIRNPERATRRRNLVLSMMRDNKKLTQAQYDSLRVLPLELKLNDPNRMKNAPYFTEYVRIQLNKLQKELGVNVYEDGLRVYTSINTKFQYYMDRAITKHIDKVQERVRRQRVFTEMKEEHGDSLFLKKSHVELAFVAINPHTGHILAMVGGRDFEKSKFNRATQAKRQPGSSFKPFLYTAAIDNGYSPSYKILNQPTTEINADGSRWTPENYNKSVGGLTTLREAIRRSLNLVAVRLINEVNPRTVRKYASEMGISTQIRPFSSLALGTSEVYPLELVSAYGIFANNGVHVKPVSIVRIEDRNGTVIYSNTPEPKEVLSPETTHIVRNMMEGVMNRGTGYPVRRDFKFYNQAGGKTGTTNDFTDAWFVGYTPDIVAGIWVGLDDPKQSLGRGMAGGVAALPFWGEFMKTAYDSVNFVHANFVDSPEVLEIEICTETLQKATSYCPEPFKELFTKENAPEEGCQTHKGMDSSNRKRRRRF